MVVIEHSLLHQILLIFVSSSLVAVAILFLRQAIIVAYILAGFCLGSAGLGLITDAYWIEDLASVGIVYLLFLLGLNLRPQKAVSMFGEALFVTFLSTIIFSMLLAAVVYCFGYGFTESTVIGAATAFSSTIIGLKLLPTTTLHHKRRGEMIISVLLLQDFIAIALILLLTSVSNGSTIAAKISFLLISLPIALFAVFLIEKYVVNYLIARFDEIHEFIFILAIGWCSLCALVFEKIGFSYEVGGFVAGVALASSPASLFFAEKLKPIRDFFLVLFFFSLGASFDFLILEEAILVALPLSFIIVVGKPYVFRKLFRLRGESRRQAKEVGVRLGQAGEFGILLGITAFQSGTITYEASYLINLIVILTLIFSSFYITSAYHTPTTVKTSLRKD